MKERRPTVAQELFIRHRDELADLSLDKRFARIHEMNLWGAETSRSGLGSELDAVKALAAVLPSLCEKLEVKTLVDAPCGDGDWIASLPLGHERYIGLDIVPNLISHLSRRFSKETRREYRVADLTEQAPPTADLILCRDCLVHLSFENIGRVVSGFKNSGSKWLLTTHFTDQKKNIDIVDGDWRPLNFCKAPFQWPIPDLIINEDCAEADGSYRDKSMALWMLKALPG